MAASKKIGLVLALDKDKEFLDALRACKEEVKAYRDSVKELDDKFKANEGTLEDLQKKNEELTKQQEAYSKQLDAAKTGLDRANEVYQRQAEHLNDLRDKLAAAEEAQQRMKDEGLEGTEAYKQQTEEVDRLREAVAKQSANVATAEQKVNSWTREVKNAESGLEQCNEDLEANAVDMQNFGNQAEAAGDDIQDFADDVEEAAEGSEKLSISIGDMVKNKIIDLAGDGLKALGEKAIEAAKYMIDVGSSFEEQMSKVGAISGATGADLEALSEKAKEMGASTKFSATESGEALEYMAMAGWKTNEMIGGLEGIMNLAAASGESLATTSDIVTDALTAFGKTAEDSGRLADIMAAASSNANTNVGMMGETFKYAAPVAGALGYTMEDTSIAIGLMANAGIKASQAGTSIRAGLSNLVKPAKSAAEAMDQYNISVTDGNGKMYSFREMMVQLREKLGGLDEAEKAAAASAIFGKNAMSGWLAIINASDADFEKLTAAVDGSAGAAERMAGTMQDNLAGKITILQSALEGLAIAVYEHVSGPLQAVVSVATEIISGITDLISPQRTELEKFTHEIEVMNEEVERSIQNAQATVEGGEAKSAEIEAYKGILDDVLTSCEQFNYVDLGDGKYQILDATGAVVEEGFEAVDKAAGTTEEILEAWASGGLNTDGIKASSEEAKGMIGYIKDEADTVEERLSKFAEAGIDVSGVEKGKTALVQIFDDMGNEVESFETDISKAGAVEIDTSGVKEGTDAMITFLDDALEGVESFRGSLSSLGDGSINLSQIKEEFDKVEDSVRQTYVITDEFTKSKISAMVDALGGSVEGLADAWNSQTGELTASHEELLKWFDTAKEVAMYEALEDALQTLYKAWGDAAVNCASAQGALNAVVDEFNNRYGTAYESFIELNDAMGVTRGGYGDLTTASRAAWEELQKANATFEEAETELNNTTAALEPLKENLDAARNSTDQTGISAEQAAKNLEALEDAEEGAGESADAMSDSQQRAVERYLSLCGATDEYLKKQEELSETDLAEWCEEKVVAYLEKAGEEYSKFVQSVADSMSSYALAMQTSTEEGEVSLTAMIDSLEEKQERVRTWTDNMIALGEIAGNGFSQSLYDELLKEGPEKGYEKVQAIVDAMEAQTPEFERLSREYDESISLTTSANTLASYSTAGKEYEAALASGFTGSLEEYYNAVEGGIDEAVDIAANEAEGFSSAGETGGTKTKEGIDSTADQVRDAAEGMLTEAREASDQIATDFYVTGQQIPQELRRGINVAKHWADSAIESMVSSMDGILKDSIGTFNGDGSDLVTQMADGMRSSSYDVTGTVSDMLREAADTAADFAYEFGNAGSDAAIWLAQGIQGGAGDVWAAANDVAQGAYDYVSNMVYSFEDAGYSMMVGLGNGIANGSSFAIVTAQNVAIEALVAAKSALGIASPSKEFARIGRQTMEGFEVGIEDQKEDTLQAMSSAMSGIRDTALDELRGLDLGVVDGTVSLDAGVANGAFESLQIGAEKAMESALAMQELEQSMANAEESFLDMSAVISGLLDQMTALSRAVSGMDINPSVSVQIGNKAIDSYIARASINGMEQAQRNIMASQGWG